MTMAEPITFLPGTLDVRAVEHWRGVKPRVRDVLRNAVVAHRERVPGEPLQVRGATGPVDLDEPRAPAGPWWHSAPHRGILRVR